MTTIEIWRVCASMFWRFIDVLKISLDCECWYFVNSRRPYLIDHTPQLAIFVHIEKLRGACKIVLQVDRLMAVKLYSFLPPIYCP